MPRNKRPLPRKSNNTPQPNSDAQLRELSTLALTVIERGEAETGSAREEELLTAVRRALRRKHDEVLLGAIEYTKFTDPDACRYLRGLVGEEAASQRIRKEQGPEIEIDAFMIPLFVRSTGGLVEDEAFADEEAYTKLVESFQELGLESEAANVVLVRHLYDMDEVDSIGYSQLHEVVREAAASMTSRKPMPMPLLESTMTGWSGQQFSAEDAAMELRFLLGFALKPADDPFYAVPEGEADSDAYYDARMMRYRAWTVDAEPLVRRCLAADPERVRVDFLYQDLFFGARESATEEMAMLLTLAEVNQLLGERGMTAEDTRAVVAVLDGGENALLRTNLYAGGDELVGSIDKPVDLSADLGEELDDMCDALLTFGFKQVETAADFTPDGQPEGAERFDRL
ncbi:hypothetical protein GCM10027321_01470 [Massilia terrae]|uniref:DUF2863 family protein n=1 Tax=Massilia terrae TaxID=1811224 RepID=A0ABT2CU41_9BURK|nr:DUF2863 family protein [Massilia terrae]MCS0657491.1 DUF2863 family protein [Massilia terrae]